MCWVEGAFLGSGMPLVRRRLSRIAVGLLYVALLGLLILSWHTMQRRADKLYITAVVRHYANGKGRPAGTGKSGRGRRIVQKEETGAGYGTGGRIGRRGAAEGRKRAHSAAPFSAPFHLFDVFICTLNLAGGLNLGT